MKKSLEIVWKYLPALLESLPTTLYMLVISVFIAAILGFFLAWAKIGKNPLLKDYPVFLYLLCEERR